MCDFYAHIRHDPANNEKKQTVSEHCKKTAEYASQALASVKLGRAGYLAGLLHDEGKCTEAFQKYLHDPNGIPGSVDHSSYGLRLLLHKFHGPDFEKMEDVACEIMAYAVAAHHGLMDVVNENGENGFSRRLNAGTEQDGLVETKFLLHCALQEKSLTEYYDQATNELVSALKEICTMEKKEGEADFYTGLLTRLVLSAVIEGDRRDTAEFMGDTSEANPVMPPDFWEDYLNRVETKISEFDNSKPINKARKEISDICRSKAESSCGVYRLNVPTGGGKTLAGLRFALAHAAHAQKKRIIFTSPLLSILDQNAEVIREFIQDDSIILEHHSNVVHEQKDAQQTLREELCIENWSAPVIITTLVQLLNTLFSGKSSCIRRFHSLCDSVIVIDEVQTVPRKLLTLFHLAVNFLSSICNATVVLCSATQPCPEYTEHPICGPIEDLVSYDEKLWNVFCRTEIIDKGKMKLENVPKYAKEVIADNPSLLIVCNTKAEAYYVYGRLCGSDNLMVFYLSAGMCMAHRRKTLEALRRALWRRFTSPDEYCRVVCVSTPVIEAGVDISFGSVIRFAAGMDSIIQAAGRCNREGECEGRAQVYIILCEEEQLTYLKEIADAQKATLALLDYFKCNPDDFMGSLFSDPAIERFYKILYGNKSDGAGDGPVIIDRQIYTLYQLLSDNCSFVSGSYDPNEMQFYLKQAFRTAGQAFEVFDEDTTDVIVPYDKKAEKIIEKLRNWKKLDVTQAKELLNEAKPYIISIYEGQRKRLADKGAISVVGDGSISVLDSGSYSKDGVGILSESQEMQFLCI